jgi:hypothetical protein
MQYQACCTEPIAPTPRLLSSAALHLITYMLLPFCVLFLLLGFEVSTPLSSPESSLAMRSLHICKVQR